MFKKVCFILLFLIILAECTRFPSRRNSKKESRAKTDKNVRARGDVFENMFSLYDPTFLSTVWPKIRNGVHLTLSNDCFNDSAVFYEDFARGHLWAYMVADSSGRYEPGVFAGQGLWLGDKRQCFDLDRNLEEASKTKELPELDWTAVGSNENRAHHLEDTRSKFPLAYSVAKIYMTVINANFVQNFDLTLGLCLPRSCDRDDITSILTFSIMLNDNLKSNRSHPRVIKMTSLREVTDHYNFHHDLPAMVLSAITLSLILISMVATITDIKIIRCKRTSRSISFDLQKYKNTDISNRFLDIKSNECIDSNRCGDVSFTNNFNNGNTNVVGVKNVNLNPAPPVTLDVVSTERVTGSCDRCGKYRRQCKSPKEAVNLPPCPRVKYSSVASLTTQEIRSSLTKRLFLCFSLKYCLMRIFNTNMANKDMSMMHLVKIVATLWVIFVHVAVIVSYSTVNTSSIHHHDDMYYILATGTLAFDTLFFVSGLFSAHHYFYLRSHYTVEELVSFGGFFGQILQYICFITNRAVRLLPSYIYTIFLSGVLARMSLSTSPLTPPDGDHVNCDSYWWRNILYVTTLYPVGEECMQVSWYLSTESQLHVIGALLCALGTGRRGRVIASLLMTAMLATTAADVTGAYRDYVYSMPGVFSAYSTIINRPWARVVPYFTGVIAGWSLYKTDGVIKVSKMARSWLWLVTLTSLSLSLSLPWLQPRWAAAWLHLTWPAALMWPALLAGTRYKATTRRILNNSMTCALSRLTYSALLLHGPVARYLLLDTDTALCSQTLCIWSYFAGTTLLTLFGALLLSLFVEIPFCCILRRLSDCANK